MLEGKRSSSLPECCYSGLHASASVSANERDSALFHLLSLDQELASPKTDTARGTERERQRERNGCKETDTENASEGERKDEKIKQKKKRKNG